MSADRKIIDRVRQQVRRPNPKIDPEIADLAEQFAGVVARVNRRLDECAAFLAKGLRTEARHVAEAAPPLLDLARILLAEDFQIWQDFCQANGLREPVPVPPDLVEMLACAIDGGREGAGEMERLLALHRRVSLIGNLKERIRVLRRIRAMEPANAFWTEDLASLDLARHRELPRELEGATRAADEARLQELRMEVWSRDWVKPPPDRFRDLVVERHRALRRQVLEGKARELAQAIADAHSAFDVDGLARGLEAWDASREDEDFPGGGEAGFQVEEASRWLGEERRRRAEDAEFQQALDGVWEILDGDATEEEIEVAIRSLDRFGREVPPDLDDQANARMDALRRARVRQVRLKVAAVAAGVLTIAGGIAVVTIVLSRRAARADRLTALDRAISEEDWSGANDLLGRLDTEDPDLAALPECEERRARIEDALAEIRARKEAFETTLGQVEAMRAAGFQPFTEARRLVDLARGLSADDEDRLNLARLRSAVEAAAADRQAEIDRRFEEGLSTVRIELDRLGLLDASRRPEIFRRTLDEIGRRIDEVDAIEGASEPLRDRLAQVESELASARRELDAALADARERAAQLEAVYRAPPDLEGYDRALRAVSARSDVAPETMERVQALRRLIPFFQAAVRAWPASGDDAATRAAIEEALRKSGDLPDPWKETLVALQADLRWSDRIGETRKAFEGYREVRVYHDLYAFRPSARRMSNPREVYFFFDPPRRSAEAMGDFGFTGEMVNDSFGLETTTFYHAGKEIEPARVPHADHLRGLLERMARAPDAAFAEFAWREACDLAANKALEPVVAMIFVRKLLSSFWSTDDPLLAPFARLDQEWRTFDAPVAWLDSRPETKDARKRRRAALGSMPDLAGRLVEWQFRRDLLRSVVGRRIACAGQVRAGPEDEWARFYVDAPEYWIVRPGRGEAANGIRFLVVARRRGDRVIPDPAFERELLDGEPLFAPTEGLSTSEILEALAGARGLGNDRIQTWESWPASWPENASGPEGRSR